MFRSHLLPPAPMPARTLRPSTARPGVRPATALLAAVIFAALAIASAAVSWRQADLLQRDRYPALQERRQLRIWAADTRFALQESADVARAMRLARADSVAQRFHALADEERSRDAVIGLGTTDARFTRWYIDARRAAQGLSASDEAVLTSPELAAQAYRRLDDELGAEIGAAGDAIAGELVLATRARTLAWSLAMLALVSLAHGLTNRGVARARIAMVQPPVGEVAPANAAPARKTECTQPVRAATLARAVVIPKLVRAETDVPRGRAAAGLYVPTRGAALRLMTTSRAAAARPVALYDAIHGLEQVLRDTSAGMKRAEVPLAAARSTTGTAVHASARLAATAAALAAQATELQALLANFRVVRAAA